MYSCPHTHTHTRKHVTTAPSLMQHTDKFRSRFDSVTPSTDSGQHEKTCDCSVCFFLASMVKVTFHPFDQVSVFWPDVVAKPLLTAACTEQKCHYFTATTCKHAALQPDMQPGGKNSPTQTPSNSLAEGLLAGRGSMFRTL